MTTIMHAIALLKLHACRAVWPGYQPRARKPRAPLAGSAESLRNMPEPVVIGERFFAVMHAGITNSNRPDLHEAILSVDVAMALQSLALKHAAGTAMTQEERAIAIATHHVINTYVEG